MRAGSRQRLQLIEYGPSIDLVGRIATATGVDKPRAHQMVVAAGDRAARTLGLSSSPIQFDAGGVRAIDIAGMIRLGPSLELEIAPKFLGLDAQYPRWREDFYFLANLSRHGRLLASERLRASGGATEDLSALVARSLAGMYWDNRRRPLRTYRRSTEQDVFIEGETDPLEIKFPSADGFVQEMVRYDRRNAFNASILAAAKELLPEVSDPGATAGLSRLIADLPAQGLPKSGRPRRLPARMVAWQPVVDVANDVLNGLGISMRDGFASAPGYLLNTWRAWRMS